MGKNPRGKGRNEWMNDVPLAAFTMKPWDGFWLDIFFFCSRVVCKVCGVGDSNGYGLSRIGHD